MELEALVGHLEQSLTGIRVLKREVAGRRHYYITAMHRLGTAERVVKQALEEIGKLAEVAEFPG